MQKCVPLALVGTCACLWADQRVAAAARALRVVDVSRAPPRAPPGRRQQPGAVRRAGALRLGAVRRPGTSLWLRSLDR